MRHETDQSGKQRANALTTSADHYADVMQPERMLLQGPQGVLQMGQKTIETAAERILPVAVKSEIVESHSYDINLKPLCMQKWDCYKC